MSIPESEMLTLSADAIGRQAVRSLGGYVYQLYHSLLAWLNLADDEVLFLEVAEDHAIIRDQLVSQVQVKDDKASGNITLRSKGVLQLIESHWDLQKTNPDKTIFSVFLTTAKIGAEQGFVFPDNVSGLEYWRIAARDVSDVEPLRTALVALSLSSEITQFVKTATAQDLRKRIIKPIRWIVQSDELALVKNSVRDALVRLGEKKGIPSHESERVEYSLIGELLDVILNSSSRRVTRADLLRVFDSATLTSVPLQLLQQLTIAGISVESGAMIESGTGAIVYADMLELPPRIASRTSLTEHLAKVASVKGLLWLHGSSGLGKTTLAKQIAWRTNPQEWLFVDLRGCSEQDIKMRLFAAGRASNNREIKGIILDDFATDVSSSSISKLAQFVFEARLRDSVVVATSAYEPTPEIIARFGAKNLQISIVPYLSEGDIGELVTQEHGDPAVWTKVIYILCGQGHPQLVNASILGLSARNWPSSEIVGEIISGGGDETRRQKDAVLRRLINELPPSSKELVYRLSALVSGFDRKLVQIVAQVPSSLQYPEEAFIYLVGPWIEKRGADSYMLSPLLSDSGSSNLSETDKSLIRKSVVDNLLQRKPFPAEQLLQLLVNAYHEKHLVGLKWFANAMLQNANSDRPFFALLAEQVASFPLFFTPPGQLIVPQDADLSALLRIVQCLVAISTKSDLVPTVFDFMLIEIKNLPDQNQSNILFLYAVTKTLMNKDAGLSPEQWIPILVELRTVLGALNRSGVETKKLFADKNYELEQTLFAIQATSVETVEELFRLFVVLDKIDGASRDYFMSGLKAVSGLLPLINSTWAQNTKALNFDAKKASDTYGQLASFADNWTNLELSVLCVCAQVRLLDGYVGQPEHALAVVDQAIDKYGSLYPLLRRKQAVLFGLGKHELSLEILKEVRQAHTDQIDPIDFLYALRDGARSYVVLENFSAASALFENCWEQAVKIGPALAGLAVGFLGDCAISEFNLGNYQRSCEFLKRALTECDKLDDGLQSRFVKHIVGHVIIWMRQTYGKSGLSGLQMKAGLCSNPEPDEYFNERTLVDAPVRWYQLAELELEMSLDVGALTELRSRLNGATYVFFESSLTQTQVALACEHQDVTTFLDLLPKHIQLYSVVYDANSAGEELLTEISTQPSAQPSEPNYEILSDQRSLGFFKNITLAFSLGALCKGEGAKIREVCSRLLPEVLNNSEATLFLNRLLGKSSPNPGDNLFDIVADAIAFCNEQGTSVRPVSMARITVDVASWLNRSGFEGYIGAVAAAYFVDVWRRIIEQRRMLLNNPEVLVPRIEDVFQSARVGASLLAELALAIDGATDVSLTTAYRQQLQDFLK